MNDKVNIAFSTDKKYINPTITAMTSVLLNTAADVNFYILYSGLSGDEAAQFSSVKNIRGCNVFTKEIDESTYTRLLPNSDGHYTTPVYYRFLIPEEFQNVERIIYLDGDVIVTGDILTLFRTNMNGYPIGMCEDMNKYNFNRRLGMKTTSIYYNAGVMILDCQIWRQENLLETLLGFAAQNRNRISFPIQDALNPCLEGRIFTLDKSWNAQVYQTGTGKVASNFNFRSSRPNIIHYIGRIKPWDRASSQSSVFNSYHRYDGLVNMTEDAVKDQLSRLAPHKEYGSEIGLIPYYIHSIRNKVIFAKNCMLGGLSS